MILAKNYNFPFSKIHIFGCFKGFSRFQDMLYFMIDHNKCPSSEKSDEKCILRKSNFHQVLPTHGWFLNIPPPTTLELHNTPTIYWPDCLRSCGRSRTAPSTRGPAWWWWWPGSWRRCAPCPRWPRSPPPSPSPHLTLCSVSCSAWRATPSTPSTSSAPPSAPSSPRTRYGLLYLHYTSNNSIKII